MTKCGLVTFVLLFVLQATAGNVSAETRCRRVYAHPGTPAEFAIVVERALDADPTGESLLDAKRCATGDRSCGTVQALLEGFRRSDPNATVASEPLTTVGQVPNFLRKLVKSAPPKGTLWMGGMVERESGWQLLWNCASRAFGQDESAWVDPDTGAVVLADDCGNPVGLPEGEKCVYVGAPSWATDEMRLALYNVPKSTCTGLKRAGESDFESPYVERCPAGTCSFAAADAYFGMHAPVGSWSGADGMNVVRLPASCGEIDSRCAVVFCRRLANGVQACGVSVRWYDFFRRKVDYAPRGSLVAEIRGDEAAASQLTRRDGRPSRLWWNFDHQCTNQ